MPPAPASTPRGPVPAPDDARLVEVATLGAAPGAYTYSVPPELAADVTPGRRVLVPFGTRRRAGVVLGPAAAPPEGTLRAVESVLDEAPLLVPEVLELVRWAAEYYAAPVGLAVRAALPPGAEVEEKLAPVITEAGLAALRDPATPPPTRKALWALQSGEVQLLREAVIRRLARERLVTLEGAVSVGAAVPLVEVVLRVAPPESEVPARHHVQAAVWARLRETPRLALDALRAEIPGARDGVRGLARRGLVSVEQVPREATTLAAFGHAPPPSQLTPDQRVAVDALLEALAGASPAAPPSPVLLEGVTGSGKTEVYLQLIAAARARGGSALVLVPEIALTPQLAGRFRSRFGPEVAVLHSGLAERDRLAEWHRVRRGGAPIVVGARSAVFAPLERPAVIIVDEEHDGSFKQEQGLRYHGRDLAIVRARRAGAVVVLGSATPSLESVHNAEAGRYRKLLLSSRVDSRPMPRVEVLDLRGRAMERTPSPVAPSGLLSEPLVTALQETVARGEQAIVFLNRRGHSTVVLCRDCGTALRCESCSVAMTWHERGRRLTCHYCDARALVPDTCPSCGSARLLFAGAGTEKLEDELAAALPAARVARLDRDTATSASRLEKLLARFAHREIDLLVGTQMVAKGHDFPGVTLVGVLLADAGLHQPDFRAAERTAQLLTQVAGRAGRGTTPGRVLVQTFAPDTPALAAVRDHDYAAFARAELAERRSLGYPPFARLCLVRIDGEREDEAGRHAAVLARKLNDADLPGVRVLGPAPAPLERLRGRFRFQILLKAARPSLVGRALTALRAAVDRVPSSVRVAVDVDPVDLL